MPDGRDKRLRGSWLKKSLKRMWNGRRERGEKRRRQGIDRKRKEEVRWEVRRGCEGTREYWRGVSKCVWGMGERRRRKSKDEREIHCEVKYRQGSGEEVRRERGCLCESKQERERDVVCTTESMKQ